jgi:hypothetical protein
LCEELNEATTFLVDTGSEPNLIKINVISPHVRVNKSKILKLCGITADHVLTLGIININVEGQLIQFHLVPNDFPISCSGILGTEFFEQTNAKINYAKNCLEWENNYLQFIDQETVIIPARSKSSFYVRIANPEIKQGYIPRLNAMPGVYLGQALVTNTNGKAHMYCINTTEEEIEILVPVLKIYPYEERLNLNEEEEMKLNELMDEEGDQSKSSQPSKSNELSQSLELSQPLRSKESSKSSKPSESSNYSKSNEPKDKKINKIKIINPSKSEKSNKNNEPFEI